MTGDVTAGGDGGEASDGRPGAPTGPTSADEPKIAPVDAWPSELADRMEPGRFGVTLNVVKTVARHPALFRRWGPLGGFLAREGLLDPRTREVVILRVGWRTGSVYEFGQHTLFARQAGMSEAEIAATTGEPARWPGPDHERDLLVMVDELCVADRVGDGTWRRLAGRWSDAEMIELLLLAGQYRAIAGFLNSVGVQREAGVPGWPTGAEPPER